MKEKQKLRVCISTLTHSIFTEKTVFLPYVYGLLRAHCEQDEILKSRIDWLDPLNLIDRPIEEMVDGLESLDVLGLSCYVWNTNKQLLLARLIRKKFPNCIIVAGGPHIPIQFHSFIEEYPYIDFLVLGEGEQNFATILKLILEDSLRNTDLPAGIVDTKSPPSVCRQSERFKGKINTPSPYLENYFLEQINYLHGAGYQIGALWETNRGCPYSCSYCDWGSATGTKIVQIPMERVQAEIKWFALNRVGYLYNSDANFGIFKRDLEIAKSLVDTKQEYNYPKDFCVNLAKNRPESTLAVSQILSEGDLSPGNTVSLQSVNRDALAAIHRENMPLEKAGELIQGLKSKGLPTYSELIIGLPEETKESFVRGFDFLMSNDVHDGIKVYPFQILPNTEANSCAYRERHEIQTIERPFWIRSKMYENSENREMAELVVSTKTMPRLDWQYCMTFAIFIQVLHCGAWTQFIARFLHKEFDLLYSKFYTGLFDYLLKVDRAGAILIKDLQSIFKNLLNDPNANHSGMTSYKVNLDGRTEKTNSAPHIRGIFRMAENYEHIYPEIYNFTKTITDGMELELEDLFRFQKQIMITPSSIKENYVLNSYAFNFHDYFFRNQSLRPFNHQLLSRLDSKINETSSHESMVTRYQQLAVGMMAIKTGRFYYREHELLPNHALQNGPMKSGHAIV